MNVVLARAAGVSRLRACLFALTALLPLYCIFPAVGGEHAASPAETLLPFRFAMRWGYVDADGDVAIPFRFEQAKPFPECGLAAVRLDGKWGFIDANGDLAVPCVYDEVKDFAANGLAPAKRGDRWGYIDAAGATALPFRFLSADEFRSDSLARVAYDCPIRKYIATDHVNAKGETFSFFDVHRGFNGMICVSDANDKHGFIDAHGDIVIPLIYDDGKAFTSAGVAQVNIGAKGLSDGGKWGLVDETGAVVLPIEYDAISHRPFEKHTLAAVKKDGKWGCATIDGAIAVPVIYEDVKLNQDNAAVRVKAEGKWGMVAPDGKQLLPCRYDQLGDFDDDGRALYADGGRRGYLNRDFAEIVSVELEHLAAAGKNGLSWAKRDGKIGFVDKNAEVVIPFAYEHTYGFFGDLAAVKQNGKWGYIDESGATVVPCEYDAVDMLGRNPGVLLPVKRGDKWGYVDRKGTEAIPFMYEKAEHFGGVNPFGEYAKPDRVVETADGEPVFDRSRFAKVALGKQLNGYIDAAGNAVVPICYNTLHDIDDYGWAPFLFERDDGLAGGFAHVERGWTIMFPRGTFSKRSIVDYAPHNRIRVRKGGKYGYVTLRGVPVVEPQYDAATQYSRSGRAMVMKDGTTQCIDVDGTVVFGEEAVNGKTVLRNARGETVWPRDS